MSCIITTSSVMYLYVLTTASVTFLHPYYIRCQFGMLLIHEVLPFFIHHLCPVTLLHTPTMSSLTSSVCCCCFCWWFCFCLLLVVVVCVLFVCFFLVCLLVFFVFVFHNLLHEVLHCTLQQIFNWVMISVNFVQCFVLMSETCDTFSLEISFWSP